MAERRSLQSYAETRVSPGQSHDAIERLLRRIGVDAFRWESTVDAEAILFRWPRPNDTAAAFRLVIHFDSERRRAQMLRALFWYLKSKVEAIEFKLVDIEQEFFSHRLTSGGQTVYEAVLDGGLESLVSPEIVALPPGGSHD